MERKVVIFDHPLIQHKLSILRNENTSTKDFRELVNEIAMLMTFEATRDLPTEQVDVKTPCGIAKCNHIAGRKLAFVPILRAGLGMVDGCVSLVPAARIGHIGLYRDETTHTPVEYYCKLPKDIDQRDVYVVDPMLATGGSAIDANDSLSIDAIQQPFVETTLNPFDGVIPNPTAVVAPSPSNNGPSKGAELPSGDSQKEP